MFVLTTLTFMSADRNKTSSIQVKLSQFLYPKTNVKQKFATYT